MKWHVYYKLMRLDKPIGILLLWFPTATALWVANQGKPSFQLVMLFFCGTVIMRSAGCIVNDIADRHVDRHVKRTKNRVLTSGKVSLHEALLLFIFLLLIAFLIVVQLPIQCFYYALLGLLFTIIYPFCKRFLHAPQLILSLAFSVSIPMVFVASHVEVNQITLLLSMINTLWVVAYDTIYAMVDREDDIRLGVNSTAVWFGTQERLIIALMLSGMQALWWVVGLQLGLNWVFQVGWCIGCLLLLYQQVLIQNRLPSNCFKAFQWSAGYGLVMWLSAMGVS